MKKIEKVGHLLIRFCRPPLIKERGFKGNHHPKVPQESGSDVSNCFRNPSEEAMQKTEDKEEKDTHAHRWSLTG